MLTATKSRGRKPIQPCKVYLQKNPINAEDVQRAKLLLAHLDHQHIRRKNIIKKLKL